MWHDACTLRAVHLTIRTPPSLQLAQAAGCIWHAFFRIPGGGPATQTLSPDPLPPGVSTGFRFTRVRARPCATPRQGPACVAWVWVSDPNEDDFCTSWLPHLPPLGRGPPFDIGTAMATFFPAPRPFCTGRPPCDINAVTYPNEFSTWSSSKAGTGQRALGFITCVT